MGKCKLKKGFKVKNRKCKAAQGLRLKTESIYG